LKHDRITRPGQENAALYALGALSQHEARAFDAHLGEECQVCEAELKQFENVVAALGAAAAPATPPSYLRDLLQVRIEKEVTTPAPTSASVIPFPEKPAVTPQKLTPPRAPFVRVLLPWAVAAALFVALLYGLTFWLVQRWSRPILDNHSIQALQQENDNLKEQLAKENAKSEELAQINAVLTSTRWQIIPLSGQDPAPDSSAKIYWDVPASRWVVTADLPPAPEGKVYQLWFVTTEAKISAGLITPDKSGHGFTVLQLPPDLGSLAAAAITLEPEGGSQQPTMPIYVLGKTS
jgi:anti-sigma-K factor RskA